MTDGPYAELAAEVARLREENARLLAVVEAARALRQAVREQARFKSEWSVTGLMCDALFTALDAYDAAQAQAEARPHG